MGAIKIGVVGGGPGGLLTAFFLNKFANTPNRVTIFEADSRLGGKILSPTFSSQSITYEAGAAEFYDYSDHDEDPLKQLIYELGLSVCPLNGTSAILQNQVISNLDDVSESFGPAMRHGVLSFDNVARNIMTASEFYHSDHPEGEQCNFALGPQENHATLQSLMSKVVKQPEINRYIETLIHSDLATEPNQTNIPYGLQNYLMNDPAYMGQYCILGGNEQLPKELANRINATILTEQRVTKIEKAENSSRLKINSQTKHESIIEEFDFVVVALPLNHISAVRFGGAQLQNAVQKHYDHYYCPAHYLRISILFEKPFWQSIVSDSFWMIDAFDGCCLYDESVRQPGLAQGVLGWLVSGESAKEMCGWEDHKLINAALNSLPAIMSAGKNQFIEGTVHRWEAAVNGKPGGKFILNLDRRHQPEPEQHQKLFFVGDYLFDTTLNGVLDSAHYVATWIAAMLEEEKDRVSRDSAEKLAIVHV